MSEKNSNLGRLGELIASLEYARRGYKILARNVRVHGARQVGEIDLLVRDGSILVFVEVKTRMSYTFGRGAEAVDFFKQRKLLRAAKTLLARWPGLQDCDYRFDVVEVDIDKSGNRATIFENVIEDPD